MSSPTSHRTARPTVFARLCRRTVASTTAAATIIAGTLLWAGPSAHADEASDGVSVQDAALALDSVSNGLVTDAVADMAGLSAETALEVQVPATAGDGVSLLAGDFDLNISLPHAQRQTAGSFWRVGRPFSPPTARAAMPSSLQQAVSTCSRSSKAVRARRATRTI
jgi:hypothetical protein